MVLFLLLAVKHGGASGRALVTIAFKTNEMPTILGVPLGTGAVRDATFRALSWAHVPVRIMEPSPSTPPGYRSAGWVNDTIIPSPSYGPADWMYDTNFVQTMRAVLKNGLVPTRLYYGSRPYE